MRHAVWYNNSMNRTIQIRLKPTPEQVKALAETTKQFTESFNAVCAEGWRLRENNAYTLHHLTYRKCKAANPALVSDHHCQARQRAAAALKATMALERKGKKVSRPQSAFCPPSYNSNTYRLDWAARSVNLSTTRGRIHVPFILPVYATWAEGHKLTTADLIHRKGKWYLYVCVDVPDVPFVDKDAAVGVDLGVTRPAVTSDNRFHGKKHWREVVKRTFRLTRKLQLNGSKSAKHHLRRLAGRQARFRRDCDHVISKRIVSNVEPGTTIVIENLTNIRARVKASRGEAKRRLHSWSFAQLAAFLAYKAEAKGCRVVRIDPRHTSQRCNACGHIYRGNRRTQSEFQCRSCGHRQNADLNASKNIRDKHLVGWATGPSGGPPSTGLSSQLARLETSQP